MRLKDKLAGSPTLFRYLNAKNDTVRNTVSKLASNVHAAASQAVHGILRNRQCISDTADHLDGILAAELQFTQAEEIREITAVEQELNVFYDQLVIEQAFGRMHREMQQVLHDLQKREGEVRRKEIEIEKIIHARVVDAEARAKRESTTSRGLLDSAQAKAEKIFDQNKITRFACATISRFQEEFVKIQDSRDVERVTRLFQDTIEPFQITKMVTDKEGKLAKVIISSFSDACYQDLFFFFYKYYNELIDQYETEQKLPAIADELARIFSKKQKGAEQIITEMHKRKKQGIVDIEQQ